MLRPDLALVVDLIPSRSRVLDLGCAEGDLLSFLMTHKECTGTGVDTDHESIVTAVRRGVSVIELDLNSQLDQFADNSYDTVVLSRTLQAVRRPGDLLPAIGRIADRCIVSVPNFGLWKSRLSVLGGHMPISKDLPFEWYDSPNVRYTTLADLERFFDSVGFDIEQRIPLTERGDRLHTRWPNLRAGAAMYVLRPQLA